MAAHSFTQGVIETIFGHVRLAVRLLIAALIAMAILVVSLTLRVLVDAPDEGLSVVAWLLVTLYLMVVAGRRYLYAQ